ncbi:endolytic transglycosylase MltG [Roseiterribacter gracilis]|uniref:Endolytic murein transglycosylase n=1 Tax=Roseiterribacter gracilis TaxID=2812848 RepID=A0A8S8XCR5_9PROT|nr:aminodeoxychorismate lyase [Rhodospirillales bacterium TMPK1]
MRALVRLLGVLLTLALLAGGAALWVDQQMSAPAEMAQDTTIVVPKGSSTEEIAKLLYDAHLIPAPWTFMLATRFGDRRSLKAGEYLVASHPSAKSLVQQLRDGKTIVHRLTIAEGLSVTQILDLVKAEPALSGELGGDAPPEGSLLPETYNFSLGDVRADLVQRMRRAADAALDEAWRNRAPDLALTDKRQLLILASVIEKETGVASERGKVAAVFLNRLAKKMRLQSDPTTIYGLTLGHQQLGRSLTRADLDSDTPYNTYAKDGLPPGPICNPGKASLAAAAKPETGPWLYFVADGTGGHAFATTLDEHNKNVAIWRAKQKPN